MINTADVANILLAALGFDFSLVSVIGALCVSCIIIVSTYRFLKKSLIMKGENI